MLLNEHEYGGALGLRIAQASWNIFSYMLNYALIMNIYEMK